MQLLLYENDPFFNAWKNWEDVYFPSVITMCFTLPLCILLRQSLSETVLYKAFTDWY